MAVCLENFGGVGADPGPEGPEGLQVRDKHEGNSHPPYPGGVHSKTPGGCLTLGILLDPIYATIFPVRTYVPVIKFNL